ncbi:MAG: transcription termination/antitermination protein NusG [Elusimicrobiota bacterium]|nr:transcription termination/antitermination protein NusG [Endomicrobiia bacterium]MDW8165548.1 transcription termination/antitermination protein NusG [Elusimicrobiota bacterium]
MSQEEKNETLNVNFVDYSLSDWYVVFCKGGKELEIKNMIEEKIATRDDLKNKIFEVLAPEEEEIQIKKSKKIKVKKAVYKGYIYVRMKLSAETYDFIRSISGVKGFLGGANPQKISEKEIENIKKITEKLKTSEPKVVRKFDVGNTVRIIDGPFKHFTGVVEEINESKGKLKIVLTVFGRPTTMELDFTQVEKV